MARKRSRKRKKGSGIQWPRIQLTRDQWLDILGYVLLAVAGLTLLSFPSASHGVIPGWWLTSLRGGLGWGAYLTPLFFGAGGLWLILREFGDRLPRVTPAQVVGVVLSYLALLVTLHLPVTFLKFEGDLFAAAGAGVGGGIVGAFLGRTLLRGLGGPGTVVALGTWWAIGLLLALRLTVQDVMQRVRQLMSRVRPDRSVPLPPEPASLVVEGTEATAQKAPRKPASAPEVNHAVQTSSSADVEPGSTLRPHMIGSGQVWELPVMREILEPGNEEVVSASVLRQQARLLEDTLESLGAPVRVREINHGPVVTQFGVEPLVFSTSSGKEKRVKVGRISALADDLALALEARTLRVEAPIPGKGLVGIEIPNPDVSLVALRDVMESETFQREHSPLRLGLGQDVSGQSVVADLTEMPHLLIAGTTGSGKSVCINAIIAALLLQYTPDYLRFLMVDPKRVELTGYDGIPHLLAKVVVDMERVTSTLHWVLREMDGRYRRFSDARATNIRDYNERVAPKIGEKPLPYIVVIVDELADMMMMAPQETERAICRIAQMARATGIHLVIATQRPSVDVVTGLIKANFPARIAFNVASAVDSRVILDLPGAEQLLGQGDMLFLPPDVPTPMRLQGTFVSDDELRRLVQFWKQQGRPEPVITQQTMQQSLWGDEETQDLAIEYEDELLPDVIELVLAEDRASISLFQRKLRIGYTRAARIMDILEEHNVVGPQPSGGKAREVFSDAAHALLAPEPEAE